MSSKAARTLAASVFCAALASVSVNAQASAPETTAAPATAPAVSEKLLQGELESSALPYPGSDIDWGRAQIVLNAPMDKVMAVVGDYAGYYRFLPNFETSKVLSQRGSSALVYVQLKIMNGAAKIWAELKLREQKPQGSTRIIEGTMTKGNVKLFAARWEVTPVDANRTLVAIQMMVDPDLPLPDSLMSSENRKSARKTLRALREQLGLPAPK